MESMSVRGKLESLGFCFENTLKEQLWRLVTLQTFDQRDEETSADQPKTKTETMKIKKDNNDEKTAYKTPQSEEFGLCCYMIAHGVTRSISMRISRDLSQFRFHPILSRHVVSCKTIIGMEPASIPCCSDQPCFQSQNKDTVYCCHEI